MAKVACYHISSWNNSSMLGMETSKGEECTKDGTVDLRGNAVVRSKRGGWKACSFVVVYEVFERMAYYGISTNLVLYLTNKLHEGTVTAANNVTNWAGTVWILPIFGAYIADAHLGRYWTFIVSSIIYLMGMCLLTAAVSIPSLKPDPCIPGTTRSDCTAAASSLQLGVFFLGLYTLAVGTGGTKPNISTIGADQFDEFDRRERSHKLSFFNWWMFSIFSGTLFANTVLVYIQDNVGWSLGYALPTVGLAISVSIFVIGTPFYRHKRLAGSPVLKIARVVFAAVRNWRARLPADPKDLFEFSAREGVLRIEHTPSLRFLSKAAIRTGVSKGQWRLCPVTQVEEAKQMVRMIPIFVSTFIPSAMLAQVGTLFIKQGVTLDRHMSPHFRIPPASLSAFTTVSMLLSIFLYDRAFVPFARRFTGNPRGISLLCRMATGFVVHILAMLAACFAERRRLAAVRAGRKLSVFILLPQFSLMGFADAFAEVAKIEFFYDQAPEGMKSLGTSYAMATLGVGNFLSSFLLSTAEKLTRRMDGGWIQNDLDRSHLDYYYAFLAVLSVANFFCFLLLSRLYVYRAERADAAAAADAAADQGI